MTIVSRTSASPQPASQSRFRLPVRRSAEKSWGRAVSMQIYRPSARVESLLDCPASDKVAETRRRETSEEEPLLRFHVFTFQADRLTLRDCPPTIRPANEAKQSPQVRSGCRRACADGAALVWPIGSAAAVRSASHGRVRSGGAILFCMDRPGAVAAGCAWH